MLITMNILSIQNKIISQLSGFPGEAMDLLGIFPIQLLGY